jgi:porphobilinogen synthase
MHYPDNRLRRLRRTSFIRDMVQEYRLDRSDLIWPLFVIDGVGQTQDIHSMPGVKRLSVDLVVEAARRAIDLGIPSIALFPKTEDSLKSELGEEAVNPNNLICRTVKAVKKACPDIAILCDVALDPYTSHGHDGVLDTAGYVENDRTVEMLVAQSKTLADAGCDIIAPSDMMDGRIGAIRNMLEDNHYQNMLIMAYAAKYASAFYGPFRDAVGAGKKLGGDGKQTYQLNPANSDEAIREIEADIAEGADMVMVKPGMPYLDIIRRCKDELSYPCFAYQVSGEYAMLKSACEQGWLSEEQAVMEAMMCFKRAGASGILTYFAPYVAERL